MPSPGCQPVAEPRWGQLCPAVATALPSSRAGRRRPSRRRRRAPASRASVSSTACSSSDTFSACAARPSAWSRSDWAHAPALGVEPREAQRRLVGERLGDQCLVGRPRRQLRAGTRHDGRASGSGRRAAPGHGELGARRRPRAVERCVRAATTWRPRLDGRRRHDLDASTSAPRDSAANARSARRGRRPRSPPRRGGAAVRAQRAPGCSRWSSGSWQPSAEGSAVVIGPGATGLDARIRRYGAEIRSAGAGVLLAEVLELLRFRAGGRRRLLGGRLVGCGGRLGRRGAAALVRGRRVVLVSAAPLSAVPVSACRCPRSRAVVGRLVRRRSVASLAPSSLSVGTVSVAGAPGTSSADTWLPPQPAAASAGTAKDERREGCAR